MQSPLSETGRGDGHGGKVTAHSEGGGRGAAFVVRLPLTSACPTSMATS
jgi:hypothetical protein